MLPSCLPSYLEAQRFTYSSPPSFSVAKLSYVISHGRTVDHEEEVPYYKFILMHLRPQVARKDTPVAALERPGVPARYRRRRILRPAGSRSAARSHISATPVRSGPVATTVLLEEVLPPLVRCVYGQRDLRRCRSSGQDVLRARSSCRTGCPSIRYEDCLCPL